MLFLQKGVICIALLGFQQLVSTPGFDHSCRGRTEIDSDGVQRHHQAPDVFRAVGDGPKATVNLTLLDFKCGF